MRQTINGDLIAAVCNAAGLDVNAVTRIWFEPNSIEFHFHLHNDEGRPYLIGNDVAMGTKRVGIEWTKP
jgi:hypothetical protein